MATVHADLLNWLASQMLGKYKADITHSAIYIAFDDHSHAALFKLFWLDSIMDEVAYAGAID